jgi:CspA family cold shock protein
VAQELSSQRCAKAQGRGDTMTGVIKKIIRDKGFGFIKPDDSSEDVFFHRSSLAPRVQIEDINEGDTVQFQTRKGDKGPVAFDLKVR